MKREIESTEGELKNLRDTYLKKQSSWNKEKQQMEEQIKTTSRLSQNGGDADKQRLKALYEQKQGEYDQLKKEYDAISDQMDFMRKESDELRKKLDDYDKVNKIQRTMSADSSAMEKEIRQLKIR